MAEMYQLDYGYRVRILSGEHEGMEGIVTMGSRLGNVGISFGEKPAVGRYDTKQKPRNIEVVSRETPADINPNKSPCLTVFDQAKIYMAIDSPEKILESESDFPEFMVTLARRRYRPKAG